MKKTKDSIAVARCPYCNQKHRYEPNMEEFRFIYCDMCDFIFAVNPLNPQEPFDKDDRIDIIYRIKKNEFATLLNLAVETNDKEWFQELCKKMNELEDEGWWVGRSDREKNYYSGNENITGVKWVEKNRRWLATIKSPDCKTVILGLYETQDDAEDAYRKSWKKLYGGQFDDGEDD